MDIRLDQIDAKTQFVDLLTGEIIFFGLLGKLLYLDLDREWLQYLASQDVFAEAPFEVDEPEIASGLYLVRTWFQKHDNEITDRAYQELVEDQTRLFIGLERVLAPAWESVYLSRDHLTFQEQTLQVRNWYRRFHLEFERIHREPDDHIGLELIFISHLARYGLQALEQDNPQALCQYLQAQMDFMEEHILRWAPRWCELVSQHAQTDFYRGLALLTMGGLRACRRELTSFHAAHCL